ESVLATFSRWQDMLDVMCEEQRTDPIVVPDRGHREHRGELRGDLALEALARTESLGARQVDGEHHRELALLDVSLDVRPAHARCDVPIDAPNLIARLILADL